MSNGEDSRFEYIRSSQPPQIIADRQKNAWVQGKINKEHDEDFLTRGLWGKSRHPNFFGESMLWTGIAITAAGVLMSSVGQRGMGLSGGLGKLVRSRGLYGESGFRSISVAEG